MADAMGIELLTEKEYRDLQKLGQFDAKTSSWISFEIFAKLDLEYLMRVQLNGLKYS